MAYVQQPFWRKRSTPLFASRRQTAALRVRRPDSSFRPTVMLLEDRLVLNNFGYTASSTTFTPLDISGQSGTFVIDPGADDNYDVISNFGSNTFRFYNNVYTGNNSIFVCTNGFITVGSAPFFPYYSNDDLSASSQQNTTAICPYWDDLYPTGGVNEVLGKYDTISGQDVLIIQWNQAQHYPGTSGAVTFQAILYLNTGTNPGKMVFNYVSTDFGDSSLNDGASATVGIKNDNTAPGGGDPLVVWLNGGGQIQPISGSAIQIQAGSQISGTKFEDLNGNGVRDPGEPALAGWVFYLDANGNGRLDPGEASTTTDGSGQFLFDHPELNPGPGTYTVREVQRPGWRQTTPTPPAVVVTAQGANASGLLFGNQRIDTIATGTDAGGAPRVHVYRAATGDQELFSFYAYEFSFTGGVRVAAGDFVNGTGSASSRDGLPDIVTAPGPGRPAEIRIFNGANPLTGPAVSLFPFGSTYTGGLFITTGDVTGDGVNDLIIGSGLAHAPEVRILDGATLRFLPVDIFPYESTFRNGVHVATGDMNHDGRAEVVTAPANGRAPQVRIYDLRYNTATGGDSPLLIRSFMAYASTNFGGVWVTAGTNLIVTGSGINSFPIVHVYNGAGGLRASFQAYANGQSPNGVRVGLTDINGDGIADIVTAPGPGAQPLVRYFNGSNFVEFSSYSFWTFEPTFLGGVFIGNNPR